MTETVETANVRPLEDVLAYRNDLVIESFTDKFAIAREDAEKIFVEVLRWLWYVASIKPTEDNPQAHDVDEAILVIDEMWHMFILATRDYAEFCEDMFGRFIHHIPGTASAEAERVASFVGDDLGDKEKILAKGLKIKRAKYLDIYKRLGENVFVTWYQRFPQEYTVDAIYRLRKR